MKLSKLLFALIIVVFVALGAYAVVAFRAQEAQPQYSGNAQDDNVASYSSSTLRLAFNYPDNYFLEEKDVSTPQRGRYAVILTEDTEENRLVREGKAPGREGPVAITVDVFQNNLEKTIAETWVRSTNDSNYKLSPDGMLTSATVGSKEGVLYSWDGLYGARSVVVADDNFVYMFTVTYLGAEDQIIEDFEQILKTVQFN